MIIAIDGPAGAGKSSIAKMVAKQLGFYFLNTGSFYRAFTLAQLEKGLDPLDKDSVLSTANNVEITVKDGNICIDCIKFEPKLHTAQIDKYCSQLSVDPRLREKVNELARSFAKKMDIVTEGRDTTTVIFPNADYKFYFDASAEIRARRRMKEQQGQADYNQILQGILQRDKNDMEKSFGALKKAPDAIIIDTSNLTMQQVCEKVINAMHKH